MYMIYKDTLGRYSAQALSIRYSVSAETIGKIIVDKLSQGDCGVLSLCADARTWINVANLISFKFEEDDEVNKACHDIMSKLKIHKQSLL